MFASKAGEVRCGMIYRTGNCVGDPDVDGVPAADVDHVIHWEVLTEAFNYMRTHFPSCRPCPLTLAACDLGACLVHI